MLIGLLISYYLKEKNKPYTLLNSTEFNWPRIVKMNPQTPVKTVYPHFHKEPAVGSFNVQIDATCLSESIWLKFFKLSFEGVYWLPVHFISVWIHPGSGSTPVYIIVFWSSFIGADFFFYVYFRFSNYRKLFNIEVDKNLESAVISAVYAPK